ncbi:MAG: carboxypeptidase-like regulatory domain-containing protein [Chlorobi bacterium]|nr:carboxypeptidase-like regulatory domain-containing protein [Chlorobiota bacterium]
MKVTFMLLVLFVSFITKAQVKTDITPETDNYIHGYVLDNMSKSALPYANIYIINSSVGTISNETGYYAIDITNFDDDDSIRFQYIGYKTIVLGINELKSSPTVYLNEDITNLRETLIFGDAPDAEYIVKQIIRNKDSNYRNTCSKKTSFIRERYTNDIDELKFDIKKNSIEELNEDMAVIAENSIPRHSTSYTDFLGYFYMSDKQDDSVKFKTEPIRVVSLKEKNIAALDDMEKIFNDLFIGSGEKEYWKVRTGILSQTLDIDDESDTTASDSVPDNQRKMSYYNRNISNKLKYSLMDNKDDWEFLYKTSRYKYTIMGGTSVNGVDVYIIDFAPGNSGLYQGRIYVSTSSFALVRADYGYAPNKNGKDFNMFGVGYSENRFYRSIYFENTVDGYALRYLSKRDGASVSFRRKVSLLKKRKRFLFDKTLKEIKVGLNISLESESSFEILIMEDKAITHEQFANIKQAENMDVIFVDQFDDSLWKGYSIIEPTEQMRMYKKHDVANDGEE